MVHEIRVRVAVDAKTLRGAAAAGLLAALAVPLSSESITLTTYYPAPVGIYQKMTTTKDTVLARDNGNVGIGTNVPGAKLDVNGTVIFRDKLSVANMPSDPTSGSTNGMIYYNTSMNQFRGYQNGAWTALGGGGGKPVLSFYDLFSDPAYSRDGYGRGYKTLGLHDACFLTSNSHYDGSPNGGWDSCFIGQAAGTWQMTQYDSAYGQNGYCAAVCLDFP